MYIISVCLCIVVSNTYCVVILVYFVFLHLVYPKNENLERIKQVFKSSPVHKVIKSLSTIVHTQTSKSTSGASN